MIINKVIIENFKGIKEAEIELLDAPIIFIMGENGSGKSSIIDAIYFAFTGDKVIDIPRVEKGKKHSGKVVVEFEQDGVKYRIIRSWKVGKVRDTFSVELESEGEILAIKQTEAKEILADLFKVTPNKLNHIISSFIVRQGTISNLLTLPSQDLMDVLGVIPVKYSDIEKKVKQDLKILKTTVKEKEKFLDHLKNSLEEKVPDFSIKQMKSIVNNLRKEKEKLVNLLENYNKIEKRREYENLLQEKKKYKKYDKYGNLLEWDENIIKKFLKIKEEYGKIVPIPYEAVSPIDVKILSIIKGAIEIYDENINHINLQENLDKLRMKEKLERELKMIKKNLNNISKKHKSLLQQYNALVEKAKKGVYIPIPNNLNDNEIKEGVKALAIKEGVIVNDTSRGDPALAIWAAAKYASGLTPEELEDLKSIEKKLFKLKGEIENLKHEKEKKEQELTSIPDEDYVAKQIAHYIVDGVKSVISIDTLKEMIDKLPSSKIEADESFLYYDYKTPVKILSLRKKLNLPLFDNKLIKKMYDDISSVISYIDDLEQYEESLLRERITFDGRKIKREKDYIDNRLKELEKEEIHDVDLKDIDIDISDIEQEISDINSSLEAISRFVKYLKSEQYKEYKEAKEQIVLYKNFIKYLKGYYDVLQDSLKSIVINANKILSGLPVSFEVAGFSNDGVVVQRKDGSIILASNLSGGEQSILSLALYLSIHNILPYTTIILDEPFAAVDMERREHIEELLNNYEGKGSFIIVTHHDFNVENAKFIRIENGKVREV